MGRIGKSKRVVVPGMTKRDFIRLCGLGLCSLSIASLFGPARPSRAQMVKKGLIKTKLTPYFTPLAGGEVRCELCPKQCRISKGKRGVCRVRENRSGKLHSLVYGNPCALHLDPVEKIPFFHVLPGSRSLAVATAGCNFTCKFCQTWEISQASPEDVFSYEVSPEVVIQKAGQMRARSVSYTYVEPVIFFEYMVEIGSAAMNAGLRSLIHSNGFINPDPLRKLAGVIDAANIDLKAVSEQFYRELCGGELAPVLETLRILKNEGIHLEITNLLIPMKNDDMSMVGEICEWVKSELGPDTPIHFSRFYPLYKLRNLPPTPVLTLDKAREAALSSGLKYVYVGNVPGHEGENTFCPTCRQKVIQRTGYMVGEVHLNQGKCAFCGVPIPGIWA